MNNKKDKPNHIHLPHLPSPHGFLPNILDQYIHSKWPQYLLQCFLAIVSLLLILLVGDSVMRAAIVVGVASSAFTIFVIPDSIAATPRKVIGGHVVAIIIALIIVGVVQIFNIGDSRLILNISAAISVGIGIIIMVITNTEHPPAAGTSLGLIIHGFDWSSVVFIIASTILLSIIRIILRRRMINLL
ncbi:MAG: HPP family protein [SAR202 cluster bacterium]|nr:MAG: HPP family protein [SAR202 cluster bacterium]